MGVATTKSVPGDGAGGIHLSRWARVTTTAAEEGPAILYHLT
jgi:hypothetical protein